MQTNVHTPYPTNTLRSQSKTACTSDRLRSLTVALIAWAVTLFAPAHFVNAMDGLAVVMVIPGEGDGNTVFDTIQEAIDVACDGTVIFVRPGTYKEQLTITNKSIDIFSETEGEKVILDACQMGSAVLSSADTGTTIDVNFVDFNFINGSFGAIEIFNVNLSLGACNICGNFSPLEGGGIFQIGGKVMALDCNIKDNSAAQQGGGTFMSSGGEQEFTNTTFSGNISASDGGAIGSVVTDSKSTIQITDSEISGNQAAQDGGGIETNSSTTLNNCNLLNNTAGRHGGGFHTSNTEVNVNGCSFNSNSALKGGGLYYTNCTANFNSCNVNGNVGTNEGGGIWNENSQGSVDNCSISKNSTNGFGGGVFNQNSSKCFTNTNFNNCQAFRGGGLYQINNPCSFFSCMFSGNTATTSGGGIFSENSTGCYTNLNLMNNQAANGGGIYQVGNPCGIFNSTIKNNSASQNGGGYFCANTGQSTLTISRTDVTGNMAALNGGGIVAIDAPNVDLMNVNINNNAAEGAAGGCLLENAGVNFVNCRFRGNSADQSGSGLLCNAATIAKLNGCIIDGNTAGTFGGGIFNNVSTLLICNSDIVGNSATDIASAIAASAGSTTELFNSIVFFNGTNLPIAETDAGSITAEFCDIEGGFPGIGNINLDPQFVDFLGPDGVPGTGDEDYGLMVMSPCVDAGNNVLVPADIQDIDEDGDVNEQTPLDFLFNQRIVAGPDESSATVDMGAIEFQVQQVLLGDVNLDGFVNLLDVEPFIERLATGSFQAEADCNNDGAVNLLDVDPFIEILSN